MRILNLCFRDFAGAAYSLSHAMNKCHREHATINMRGIGSIYNYPVIADMRDYDVDLCHKIALKSDVIVFHSAVKAYFEALNLSPSDLKDKKKLVYFHGTEMRQVGNALMEQAHEMLGDFQAVVSTPDLFFYTTEKVEWLPVCRSFSEISKQYALCNQDEKALAKFHVPQKKVIFSHAPTDEWKKGSETFNRIITQVMQKLPYVNYLGIHNQPWDSCLRFLSKTDVHFDANAPFEYGYGAISVEASIFKVPVVTKLSSQVIEKIHSETGLKSPFITFTSEDDLLLKAFKLGESEEIRRTFGELTYNYCKAVHDEKPVSDRFLKIIEEMN